MLIKYTRTSLGPTTSL